MHSRSSSQHLAYQSCLSANHSILKRRRIQCMKTSLYIPFRWRYHCRAQATAQTDNAELHFRPLRSCCVYSFIVDSFSNVTYELTAMYVPVFSVVISSTMVWWPPCDCLLHIHINTGTWLAKSDPKRRINLRSLLLSSLLFLTLTSSIFAHVMGASKAGSMDAHMACVCGHFSLRWTELTGRPHGADANVLN